VQGGHLQGSFRLKYMGYHTGLLAHDISPNDLAVQLMTLPNIGNVTVSKWHQINRENQLMSKGMGRQLGHRKFKGIHGLLRIIHTFTTVQIMDEVNGQQVHTDLLRARYTQPHGVEMLVTCLI
jgi:hypothetical protein